MEIPTSTWEGWRAALERLRRLILSGLAGARTGNAGVAERRLERAHEEVVRLAELMDRTAGGPPQAEARRSGSTTANRVYAAKLRETWQAALAVDRERYGEDVGTDGPAVVIEMLLRDAEEELRGPPRSEQRPPRE